MELLSFKDTVTTKNYTHSSNFMLTLLAPNNSGKLQPSVLGLVTVHARIPLPFL